MAVARSVKRGGDVSQGCLQVFGARKAWERGHGIEKGGYEIGLSEVRRRSNVRLSRVRTESKIWPMFTRATVPLGLPHAPRMPVCSLSAPAQDNILLMRTTW